MAGCHQDNDMASQYKTPTSIVQQPVHGMSTAQLQHCIVHTSLTLLQRHLRLGSISSMCACTSARSLLRPWKPCTNTTTCMPPAAAGAAVAYGSHSRMHGHDSCTVS